MKGWCPALILLAGCSLLANAGGYSFEEDSGVDGDADMDASRSDAMDASGSDGDSTMPECELDNECASRANASAACVGGACEYECDPGFDDCDEMRNGCETEVASDSLNCGACNNACEGTNAVVGCNGGQCEITSCNDGFDDCDDESSNGCETDLRVATSCGACSMECAPMQICDASGDLIECSNSCGFDLCEASCVDTASDVAHCGGCSQPCPTPDRADAIRCADSMCEFDCQTGFGDCDDDSDNGCETTLTNDPAHCGACGASCSLANVIAHTCIASDCGIETCIPGFEDCDMSDSNGCEAQLDSDDRNCGQCGNRCTTGPCVAGRCDPVVEADGGRHNICVRRTSGAVFCWGRNDEGLANPIDLPRTPEAPVQLHESLDGPPLLAAAISVGDRFACAISTDRTSISCWGRGNNGRLGHGSATSSAYPVAVTSMDAGFAAATWQSIAAGESHACAAAMSGAVWCWGSNHGGQLGVAGPGDQSQAQRVNGLPGDVVELAAGVNFTCARIEDGQVSCWGDDAVGQLGNGIAGGSPTPSTVSGIDEIVQVTATWQTACARQMNGALYCWGENTAGQVGPRIGMTSYPTPCEVPLGAEARDVSIGFLSTCALTAAGGACWGRNAEGQWGDGETTPRATDGEVMSFSTLAGFASLADGFLYRGGIRDGEFYFWGRSEDGLRPVMDRYLETPAELVGHDGNAPADFEFIDGGREHACGIVGGLAYCWGGNGFGELGLGNDTWISQPQAVGLANVISVSAGTNFSCFVGDQNPEVQQAFCAGIGADQRLGSAGPTTSTPRLVNLPGQEDEVSAGDAHACARQGGNVYCWGNSGDGRTGHSGTAPAAVPGITTAQQLVTSAAHSCARLADGSISCWGRNADGQLGDGTTTSSMTPVNWMLPSGAMATKLTVGTVHTCALAGTTLYCWGGNNHGQVGDGTTTARSTATLISSSAVDITSGIFHNCLADAAGTVDCWGRNDAYQLGTGTTTSHSAPTEVSGASGVNLASGWRTTYAMALGGSASGWGDNFGGMLAQATAIVYPSPQVVALP